MNALASSQTRPDPGGIAEAPEDPLDRRVGQPGATRRHEEAWSRRLLAEVVPHAGVAIEGGHRAGEHRHLTGLAELRLPDEQHAVDPVDVAPVESESLADTHAGGSEQPDQGRVRGR